VCAQGHVLGKHKNTTQFKAARAVGIFKDEEKLSPLAAAMKEFAKTAAKDILYDRMAWYHCLSIDA